MNIYQEIKKIQSESWIRCNNIELLNCNYDYICLESEKIPSGKYLVIKKEPIPWAWAENIHENINFKMIGIEVEKNK